MMRGLGIILGFIIGNASARKWCIEEIKKASLIIDKEMKETPFYQKCLEIASKNKSNSANKELEND